ncbi:ABC transporter permease [Jatrophihabitans telluris]|uniref:ABC transporter permease n=1 Tax=Jatrophihabitans telluris TaxID=2038343 RepID=A0ABY4QWI1_9ACTN|nr:ABC transporter permease subunit [Jatrophihabitans telluris]UQX87447.1 ABC transporter permease [Jatrophihabitans telluris]
MSAATGTPVLQGSGPSIGLGNVLRSEWTKLTTVRSTYWTAVVALLSTVALGAAICARMAQEISIGKQTVDGLDATTFSLSGIYLAQIAAGALGVLVVSSEYGTGMIRASLAAVPQRGALLGAKAAVFGAASLVLGEIMSFGAFGVGQALLGRAHAGVSLSDPGVLRAVFGGGLYLCTVGLLGLAIGVLVRHTAGALSAFFGVLFAPSVVIDLLPPSWHNAIHYMPANAGSQILTVQRGAGALAPWAGFALFCTYGAAAMAAGYVLLLRRDS